MHIDQLWVYPVKSLRGTSLQSAHLFRDGFKYDRQYMLLKVYEDTSSTSKTKFENMHIGGGFPEMALFTAVLNAEEGHMIVEFNPPADSGMNPSTKSIPLTPDKKGLKKLDKIQVTMHKSPTIAYDMGVEFNSWFSKCFGFEVVFAYIGGNRRPVLGNVSPKAAAKGISIDAPQPPTIRKGLFSGFLSEKYSGIIALIPIGFLLLAFMKAEKFQDLEPILILEGGKIIPNLHPTPLIITSTSTAALIYLLMALASFVSNSTGTGTLPFLPTFKSQPHSDGIAFADVAPYLVVTTESLDSVSSLLPSGHEMDIRKFRPNVIVAGTDAPWDEDYWGQIAISQSHTPTPSSSSISASQSPISLTITQNCARCASINVDFSTGKPGTSEAGSVLKKLMKDRWVDEGTKFSPIFGRYGFVVGRDEGRVVRVGDEVVVTERNEERTTFRWPD